MSERERWCKRAHNTHEHVWQIKGRSAIGKGGSIVKQAAGCRLRPEPSCPMRSGPSRGGEDAQSRYRTACPPTTHQHDATLAGFNQRGGSGQPGIPLPGWPR